jgi:DNA modification methylase
MRFIVRHLSGPGQIVLDCFAGTGTTLVSAEQLGRRWIGCDNPNSAPRRIHKAEYKNAETTRGFSHSDIIRLYRDGMAEGHRILRPGGLMLVKCKDEIERGRQRMSHVEIHDIALYDLGMAVEDQFLLTQISPILHFGRSRYARKNHSYLWVFRKQT